MIHTFETARRDAILSNNVGVWSNNNVAVSDQNASLVSAVVFVVCGDGAADRRTNGGEDHYRRPRRRIR